MKSINFILVFLLAGCATSYQRNGITGGYSEQNISGDVWRVKFSGNGYATRETVQTYWLYRCAEIAKQKGYSGFEVLTPLQLGMQFWTTDPNVRQVAQLIMIPMYAPPTPEIEGDIRLTHQVKKNQPPKYFLAESLLSQLSTFVSGKKCNNNNVCPHVKTYLGVTDDEKAKTATR